MRAGHEEGQSPQETPIRVAARGAAAGMAATLVLSGLSRLLPGLWNERGDPKGHRRRSRWSGQPKLPQDPHDPQAVREWQERSQSPAAYQPPQERQPVNRRGEPPTPCSRLAPARASAGGTTPAGALALPQGPGPEGLAEQFAFKVASGLFESDISPYMRPVGLATHLAYGSLWGVLYGMIQSSYRLRPGLLGPLYGLVVYGVGPTFLVPAMKLMRPPREGPPERTSMLILGHILYGAALAKVFDAL
jgi:hypothetical protein